MDFHNKAREIADASGTLAKAAEMSERRGLTGKAAAEHAAGLYLAVVDQMAEDLAAEASSERARVRSILSHPAAAQRPSMARRLALDSNTSAAEAITQLESSQLRAVGSPRAEAESESDRAARFILGAGE